MSDWPTTQKGWETYFGTKKPDGTYPYPYGTEDGEPYIFPVAEFPTRQSVEAWFRCTDGADWEPDNWTIDAEPSDYPVHIHADGRYECLHDPCPEIVQVHGRWAA